jgi:hypothetical protein
VFCQKIAHRRESVQGQMSTTFFSASFEHGVPDGIFSKQKSKFVKNFQGLAMEDAGIFYDHLAYFTVI